MNTTYFTAGNWIVHLMGIAFNFNTGELIWSTGTAAAADGNFDFMAGDDLQFMDGTSAEYMSG